MSIRSGPEYIHELPPGISTLADTIKTDIFSNGNILPVGEVFVSNRLDYPILERVDFFVVSLYPNMSWVQLGKLLDDIKSRIPFEPDKESSQDFVTDRERLILGRVNYPETLANYKETITKETKVMDGAALERARFEPVNSKQVNTKPLIRISAVRLYPRSDLASHVSAYERAVREYSLKGFGFADGCLETLRFLIEPKYVTRLEQVLDKYGGIEPYLGSISKRTDEADEFTDEMARWSITQRLNQEWYLGGVTDQEVLYRLSQRYTPNYSISKTALHNH